MHCPKCGKKLTEHYPDVSGVSATIFEAICPDCKIAYQVVVDEQCPGYIDIHGEPWGSEEDDE